MPFWKFGIQLEVVREPRSEFSEMLLVTSQLRIKYNSMMQFYHDIVCTNRDVDRPRPL